MAKREPVHNLRIGGNEMANNFDKCKECFFEGIDEEGLPCSVCALPIGTPTAFEPKIARISIGGNDMELPEGFEKWHWIKQGLWIAENGKGE